MPKKKLSVEFNDLEGTNFSITYMPKFNQFSVSITDSCGRSTNSISMSYEDLRSLFKECEKCLEGKIQHTSFMGKDENIVHVYGCSRCSHGWSEVG